MIIKTTFINITAVFVTIFEVCVILHMHHIEFNEYDIWNNVNANLNLNTTRYVTFRVQIIVIENEQSIMQYM